MTEDELADLIDLAMSVTKGFDPIATTYTTGLRISTIYAGDVKMFETALCDKNGMHPVERYATLEEATAGHRRWTAAAPTLETVTKLGYGKTIKDQTLVLERGAPDVGGDN